jgi:hypothetical protein
MADDTNNELVSLLSEQLPASPAERDLAQRKRRQPGAMPDTDNSVLAGILTGGIGSDEVKRGKNRLGRPFAKDPDDGRFTPDPDK